MESVYGYFGLPFTGAAADAMRGLAAGGPGGGPAGSGARPEHRYALAEFGLSQGDVAERFGALSYGGTELR